MSEYGNVILYLLFAQPEVATDSEFPIYDWYSLQAEVGGYMGLFLGWSGLSVTQVLVTWATNREKKKRSRK